MANEIQKQYDRLEDVPSIILRIKDVYAVPDRHIRYAATKAFFGTKMAEGSSVQSHGVTRCYSLWKSSKTLKLGLTMTRTLTRGFNLQSERQGCQTLEEEEEKGNGGHSHCQHRGCSSCYPEGKGQRKGWGVLSSRGQMMYAFIAMERGTGRGSVHNSSPTQMLQRSRKLSKDEMILRLGDGKAVAAEAVGSLSLVVSDHVRIELKDYYFVPSMSNLIMTAQHKQKVDDHENAQIWHARLDHISKDRILVDTKSLEIDDLDHLPTCESCLKGKMTKKLFVGQSAIAKGLLDLVHTDVCGSLSIPARGGFSYFITFIDDHSRYGYVYLMRYKSEAFGRFKEYRLEVENQTSRKLKALRSDRVNISPSKSISQTPYEIWHGKPASYKYLRVWGCPAYLKRLVEDKLDSRSSLCRFIGYPKETVGYYFYDPAKQKVFISRNVVFLEKGFPSDNRRDEVLIEESSGEPPHNSTASFEPTIHTDGVPILRRSTTRSRVPERYGFLGLTSQLDNDSKTYGEAMSDIDSDKWLDAMKSEMDSMGSNQVWILVDPPKGIRPVGCKWVYKRKLGANGEVTAFKARLVAKGYTQRPRVDFEETYSPVAMAKSIQILLAIAAWYDYEIWQMDVKTAFLNGFVEEEIFMDQPEGFTTVGEEQKVCRLQRSIYGLKQASRSWNTCFDEVIRGYDFIKNDYDPCVYKKISGSSVTYLVLYVDDILLIGNDVKMLGDIKAWLSTQFFMKDMGEASYILGIKI
ncbi:UNVERIFIED_CONTAM: Retrovirus-related Pol polyprotein from transposon TNT 1-94 [Sesamum radiatum]|uniref:Retrovirus-related Pol polyprotein from transposon TNT 1-94 n=1 Tax=Sesamum radiatum TaxID=300843 RepID=A0AAW2TI25_SESRA